MKKILDMLEKKKEEEKELNEGKATKEDLLQVYIEQLRSAYIDLEAKKITLEKEAADSERIRILKESIDQSKRSFQKAIDLLQIFYKNQR